MELDGGEVLAAMWSVRVGSDGEEQHYPELADSRTPFTWQFPGLAAAQSHGLDWDQLQLELSVLPPARLGLVVARRPADVLAIVGWLTFDGYLEHASLPQDSISPAAWIGAVLRSWEDRFGARLLNVGPGAELRLLVSRPPADQEAALRVAAEHYAFANECDGCGSVSSVANITASILGAPIWQFWWD
jgi:uncharacterized protein DUF4253